MVLAPEVYTLSPSYPRADGRLTCWSWCREVISREAMASPHPHFRHADSDRLRVSSLISSPPMPFDTVVLNDGTRVRLAPSFPRSVSYRKPTVPGACVRNRIQMERSCKSRNSLVVPVAPLMSCPPCDHRTLQNTWSRPLRQVSPTSTRLPVTRISVTPAGYWTQPQLSDYGNEESVGVGLKQSGLARLPSLSSGRCLG